MRETKCMSGEFLCVVCPNGCVVDAEFEAGGEGSPPRLISASGYRCPRGEAWVRQEIENPMRTIASSVLVRNGDYIAASVRTSVPIPLAQVMDVMREIRVQHPEAPLRIGQVLISHPCGIETDIIVTRDVERVG